ncbi:type I-E CRISPR-associated protein Cas6/Cse3/CasE [Nocardiopsis rhodophaea]|uniref:Type I-E CRISPR-associated protein Cas6/Cse3/CasE n=1 Tax=Nocardiopsis rhodophaea TaxID=280238 RepID=A0ABN2SNN0_9ACTN
MLPDQLWLTHALLPAHEADRLVHSASAMHRRVMAMFPDHLGDQPRQAAGVLYRVEPEKQGARLLVQSRIAPNLSGLPHARTLSLLPLLEQLTPGAIVHYRIAANPTKAVRTPDSPKRRGKRTALHGAEAETWWRTKAEQIGLLPGSVTARPHDLASDPAARNGTRNQDRDKRIVNHGIRFDGVAKVEDPKRLLPAVVEGIGRGRSYGLGLLSLAPPGR